MNRIWLIGIGLVLLVVPLALASEGVFHKIRVGETTIVHGLHEVVYVYPSILGKVTFNMIEAHTRMDVEKYIGQSNARLDRIANESEYVAVITFKRPISKLELDELVNAYDLHLLSARFSSYPTGGGNMVFPITDESMQELAVGQEEIMNQFKLNKANNPELIYDENFKLFEGFVSMYVKDKGHNLNAINDQRVLLVDVGPIEYQVASSVGIVFPGKDIYDEWKENETQ